MTTQNLKSKNPIFKMHKVSYLMIAAAIIITASLFLLPVLSQSTNECAPCHGPQGYYQYLDILEGNTGTVIPTSLTVGQTTSVTVVIKNSVNTASYTSMSGVSLTLFSQNGHFSVATSTVNIGTLQKGATATATWQITGTSAGQDTLVIMANARNPHQGVTLSDGYSPSPTILVSEAVPTPIPTPTPAPTSTPNPTPAPTPISTPTPTSAPPSTSTPVPTPTSTTAPNPTPTPTLSPTPIATPAPTQKPEQTPSPSPTPTPTPTPSPSPENETPNSPEENTKQPALKVWLTTPREGETLTSGTKKTIEWTISGSTGNHTIKLELSKSSSDGPWTTIADLTNSNDFSWNVPNLDQTDYIIRAIVIDSANPPKTATVTVAVKIAQEVHIDTVMIVSSIPILLAFAVLTAFTIKKRLTQTQPQKNNTIPS